MRIKEIEARLAAIKKEIEERGDAMKAEEIDALEKETEELTEERAGLIAAAEKRNGILDNIAKGAGIVSRTFEQKQDNADPDDPFGTPEYRSAWLKNLRAFPLPTQRSAHTRMPAARARRLCRHRPRTRLSAR